MRSTISALAPLALVLFGTAAEAGDVGVYRVPRAAREALVELKATVRHGSGGGDYTAELTPAGVETLERCGFSPVLLFASLDEEAQALGPTEAPPGFTDYATMRADFYARAAANPSIAAIEVLGTSVQGREVFAMRVSGNVAVEEDEPELAFLGGIHGNEYASAEVTYLYGLRLVDEYGTDPAITAFVDANEIWVAPLLNPDGYENGTRSNVNGVDLNRDYGYQWDGWGGSPSPHSQPETRAIYDLYARNNIALTSTMHCSGDVLFYPWGFSANGTTDAAVVLSIGTLYSSAAQYNLVNSWSDYETHGELVDTAYGAFGGLCYTTEVSNNVNLLELTYNRNEFGMDAFCGTMGEGLHGLVTDAGTGAPLRAAVWVSGSEIPSYTDAAVGDLHRFVPPGTYSVTVWANGYLPATVGGISVAAGARGEFTVALVRGGNDHAFAIPAVNQDDPANSYANVSQPAWALGAPDGKACSLGREGFIALDLGEGNAVVDGPGVDVTVSEAFVPGDSEFEGYTLWAGDAFAPSTLIGSATGTRSFDLGAAGVGSTRYLWVLDDSGAAASTPLAGVELDAITVLNRADGPSLSADVAQVSLSAGGVQTLSLSAPTPSGLYYLLTTVGGTTPGIVFPPSFLPVPLNSSSLLTFTALRPNKLVKKGLALLDGSGQKTATLTIPPGQDPGLDGVVLHHAYVLLDLASLETNFVSNAESLTLVP